MRSINDNGDILATARIANGPVTTVLLVPAAPVAPVDLTVSVSGRVVTLRWTASVEAVDYVLEAGSVPGASNLFHASIGSSPGLTIAAPPGIYYVRVRARNDGGVSPPSAEVVVDVP